MIFPDPRKCKIGAHLSYPVRQSEIVEALGLSCESLDLKISYFAYKAPRRGEVRERYRVLEAQFGRAWIDDVERRLTVRPIPRQLRDSIHALLPSAFDQIRNWLAAEYPPIWYSFGHGLFFDYVPGSNELVCDRFDGC